MNAFDEHDSGQLRIGAQGDLLSLLPLPDAQIPASDGPELASRSLVLYCECETPVMDIEHDAGCRRCSRPVDFSPAAPSMTRAEGDAEARARLTQTREATK